MYKVKLFGREIQLRSSYCSLNGAKDGSHIEKPYINLYVRLTNKCQAACKFCEYKNNIDSLKFDKHKFFYILHELKENVEIRKVSFTGGEPTIFTSILLENLEMVKKVDKNIFTVVNTNGFQLKDLDDNKNINSIALSRHHYNDAKNNGIFVTKDIPQAMDIKEFKNNKIIHLSCNLMKSGINSAKEIVKYLNHAADLDIYDVGFVSLMKINDFCKAEHIDFSDLIPDLEKEGLYISKEWKNKELCKCANFLFIPENGKNVVKVYSRHAIQPNCSKSDGMQLVFDGETLTDGFKGPIIY